MRIVPFEARHLQCINVQDAQSYALDIIHSEPSYGDFLAANGDGYTVLVDGVAILCAGVIRLDDGRGMAWALFSRDSGKHFVRICKGIRRYLSVCTIRRIEASIDVNHAEGVRLAKLMGFEIEGTMRKYGRDGSDHYMMARI
jgi:hypothetical protein